MTLKVIPLLQAFSSAIRRTFVQYFTRFQLTARRAVPQRQLDFLLDLINTVPSCVLETLDGKITVEEGAAAIKGMENNKTLGSDSLPKEFYSISFSIYLRPGLWRCLIIPMKLESSHRHFGTVYNYTGVQGSR